MAILVTGAAGFVGTNLVKSLLKQGREVIATDSLGRRSSELNLILLKNEFPVIDFRHKEIEDVPSLIYELRPELVYHFAAQVAVTSSLQNPKRDFNINALGSFNIARAANVMEIPVIYTSTNKVFGDNVNGVEIEELEKRYEFKGDLAKKGIGEDFSIDSSHHTPYGLSKLVGELYIREWGGVANRCSCMYGPHQHGIVDQGWLSHFARQIIQGEKITFYGDGKQVRDVLHSRDVVRLLELQGEALCSGSPDIRGDVYNVGGGYRNTTSLRELVCDRWRICPSEINFEAWRPADQKVFYCDISKAQRVFGWTPEVGLDEGTKELYEWTEKELRESS
ncbi:MAG: NAD-dependent epimerase/dehydratase family protein [archaeon]